MKRRRPRLGRDLVAALGEASSRDQAIAEHYKDDSVDYHDLIMHNGDIELERWNLTRVPGSYCSLTFLAKDSLDAFKKLVKQFHLTFDAESENEAKAFNSKIWVYRKALNIQVFFHLDSDDDMRGFCETLDRAPSDANVFWYYMDSDGDPACADLPLTGPTPKQEFYPWMPLTLEKFAQDFVISSANVLLLVGPPGTGKTSFIRGMIRNMHYQTWVTYDKRVQACEQFYINFGSLSHTRDGRALVMEDADEMIGKRKDGNELMNRILNISDGIVTLPARKIIFSTNLPGLHDIDEALLRPGRCFAVVRFRKLSRAEAARACGAIGLKLEAKGEQLTLSEALNNERDALQVQQFGFGEG